MLGRERIRIAGSQVMPFQRYNFGLGGPTAYHDSDIVTDVRLALCNIQTSNELHESVSKGQLVDSARCAKSSELTSGVNCEKKRGRLAPGRVPPWRKVTPGQDKKKLVQGTHGEDDVPSQMFREQHEQGYGELAPRQGCFVDYVRPGPSIGACSSFNAWRAVALV